MDMNVEVAIRLIGEVRVEYRGHVVYPRVVGGARCVTLLAYLAVNRHRDVAHEELASLLWPSNRPQSWYAALRGVLSRVRDTVELASMPPGSVRSRGGNVRLSLPDGLTTDVEIVRRFCTGPRDDVSVSVANARSALALTAEPALVGAVGRWADDVRAETAQLRRRALEMDANGSKALGEYARSVAAAEELASLDPLRESAYRTMMTGFLALGERGQALRVAARCRQILDEELGVAPSAETEALYLEILRSESPAVDESAATASQSTDRRDEFVGRGVELAAIADAIGRADRGRGQFVVISGEAGSGKTTAALEVMRRARGGGAHVLVGRCSEEAVVPFEPLVEAVSGELDSLEPGDARTWLRGNGSDIARLVPNAVRRFGEMAPTPSEVDERAAIMTAALDWLTSPMRTGPTVLVIDDLHWASAATLAVIRYLVHASEKSRLCLVATVRDEYVDNADIRSTLLAPSRSGGVQRLHLGGFSLAEVGAMVDAAETTLDPATLYERTRGLPLFVASVIGSHTTGSTNALPTSVAESVAQRERLLTSAARDVLQICAVAGTVTHRLVVRSIATHLDDIGFADALDELVRNRLVTESESGTDIRLRHPLVQEAVYAGISGRRRSELHSRVARSSLGLAGAGDADEYSRLAYHFSRGLDSDRPRASEFSHKAGDSAMAIGAYEDAVVFFTSAADQLVPRGDSTARCRLVIDLGRARRKARDPAFRPTLFEAVAMAKRLGDTDLQVAATLANDQPGTLYVHLHADHERIDTLYDALYLLESDGRGDSSAAASLLAQLSIELLWVASSRSLRDLLTRAIATSRAAGDLTTRIRVLSAVLVVLRTPLCSEMRRDAYAELMGLLDSSPARRVDALMSAWIARHQIEFGELRAAALTRSGLTAARVSRDPELAWLVQNIDFAIDLAAGRLERAESKLDELRDIPASPAVAYTYGRLMGQMFALRTLRGDMSEIVGARDGITERFDVVDTYRACLAIAHVDVGNMGAAVDLVAWYDSRRIGEIPVNNMWLSTIATVGRAAAQVRNVEVCRLVYDILVEYPGENTISWASIYGVVDHHLAELAITLGDYDRAAHHLEAAFGEHERRGFAGWYAETAYLEALLESRRDGRPSGEAITRARRLADDVGATAVRRRIDAIALVHV